MANESRPYLVWIRQQPCLMCPADPCGGAHHTGRSGMGQRPHDSKAIPLCQRCHVEELHMAKGWARGLEKRKGNISAWEEAMLELTQRRAYDAGWRWRDGKAYRVGVSSASRSVELGTEVF